MSKENYKYYKSRGICIACRKEKAMINAVRCSDCAEKLAKCDAKRYKKIKKSENYIGYRKNISKKNKIRRQNRRNEKICWVCGKYKVINNKKKCIDCLTKNRKKKDYRYNNDIPRNERFYYNLCYICGEPNLNNHKVCEKHYNILLKQIKTLHNSNNSNHIWRENNNLIFKNKINTDA